jgi:hypothetical protein
MGLSPAHNYMKQQKFNSSSSLRRNPRKSPQPPVLLASKEPSVNYPRRRPSFPVVQSPAARQELIATLTALAHLELKWKTFVKARQLTATEGQALLGCILKARGGVPAHMLAAFDLLRDSSLNEVKDVLPFAEGVVSKGELSLTR